MSDMLSPLERNLTLQIDQLLREHSARIEELEARVRQLEDERAELTTMMNLWHVQARLAQEEAAGLSERIGRFLAEITRVGDQVQRAAEAMETEQQGRALVQQMARVLSTQQRQIGEIDRGMAQILALLGEPLEQ